MYYDKNSWDLYDYEFHWKCKKKDSKYKWIWLKTDGNKTATIKDKCSFDETPPKSKCHYSVKQGTYVD